jgi:hypothetical protein
MVTLRLVLMIAAFICFLLNALNISSPRGNLMGLGLALWVLAVLIQ